MQPQGCRSVATTRSSTASLWERLQIPFSCVWFAAVCAEAYNPDEDEDNDTEPQVVHPKTDEQRQRLQDACKDILLFKTLAKVQERRRFS